MSIQEHILDIYASISDKTGEMLEAAKSRDWDRLVALEQDCRVLIDCLKDTDAGPVPGVKFVQRKVALIRKALADDAEIRKFTEPWMNQLEAYLGSARREGRLQRAYETDHGG
ncbi:MAG: flagellar protein FliT [Betaproteobacteria bacterium]|nr:flagellar protein FliT [Betaproteobacteria bacterium]